MSIPMPQPKPPVPPAQHMQGDASVSADMAAALSEFQWQMAGDGHGVDLARLQQDRAYARGCLALARSSTSPILQQAADTMSRLLRVTVPMA